MVKTMQQLISITFMLALTLTACSKQGWYQGMQSAQTANCMKEAISGYDDCKQPSNENYDSYEKVRKDIMKTAPQ